MILPLLPADIPSPTTNMPIPSLTNLQASTNLLTRLLTSDVPDCTDISHYRTTTNIILTSVTTILACTWVTLHLNTPKSHQSKWQCFWRRFGWMIMALIAPEYIAGIAIKERLAAKKYMDEWNLNYAPLCSPELVEIRGKSSKEYERESKNKEYDSRWTLTHGFLADMGGLRLYDDDNDKFPKKFRPGAKIFEDPRMRSIVQQIGLISAQDIEDKSKGDGIIKFFVVILTTWFIVQCLARWALHLPVTELEVVTLVYAVQNIFIYALWWNKPQGLVVPYQFYLEKEEQTFENLDVKGETSKVEEVSLMRHSPSPTVAQDTNVRHGRSRRDEKRSLLVDEVERVQPTHSRSQDLITRIFDSDGYWLYLLFAGTIFGALHLIPLWLSVFPTDAQKQLWQISALYVTIAPWIIVMLLSYHRSDTEPDHRASSVMTVMFAFYVVAAYGVARIILLVLPFTAFRVLPEEAFLSVDWTRFITHFWAI